MYSKHRRIPFEVSHWIEKDVKITNSLSVDSGHIASEANANILLNRQFYTKLLSISYDRYRKTASYDFQKQTFLKTQRKKAKASMPGLLPRIDQLMDDMNQKSPTDTPFTSSFASSSVFKSQSTFKPQPTKLPPIKSQRLTPSVYDHARSSIESTLTDDIYSNTDDIPNYNSYLPNISKKTVDDKRFHRLIHTFSEVHERNASNSQTLKNIIQSNTSLQTQDQNVHLININA